MHHGATQSEVRPSDRRRWNWATVGRVAAAAMAQRAPAGEGGAGGAGAEGRGQPGQKPASPQRPKAKASGAAAEGGAGPGGGEGAADGGGGRRRRRAQGDTAGAAPAGEVPADGGLEALATGDIALIDEELAEHQRWGAASARVGAAGSSRRAGFIVDQAGSGALGGLGHGALMGRPSAPAARPSRSVPGGWSRVLPGRRCAQFSAAGHRRGDRRGVLRLRSATRDWGHTGETIGRFGEGGSIYEQLANSIAAVSEIIGIATAVLNVIAGVIGAISIAMWVITVLTVGVASPLAATLSTIAMAIGMATMVLDGINALVLQRLVTLFRALHTFTSQADPTDVEQQAGASPRRRGQRGFRRRHGRRAGWRRSHRGRGAPPRHRPCAAACTDVEPPRAAAGEGPTITADPPPPVETGVLAATGRRCCRRADRAAPGERAGVPAVDPHAPHAAAPTMPPAPVDPPHRRCRPPPCGPPCPDHADARGGRPACAHRLAAGRRHARNPRSAAGAGVRALPDYGPLSCPAGIPMRPAPTRRPSRRRHRWRCRRRHVRRPSPSRRHAHRPNRQRLRSGPVPGRRSRPAPAWRDRKALIRMPHPALPPGGGMPKSPVRRGCRSSSPARLRPRAARLEPGRTQPYAPTQPPPAPVEVPVPRRCRPSA